ncbi:hypothetical protein VZ95_08735 [Elstera litoralis]|uniref:Isochorismatase-like domain-containing protein n=1 Tax=Elstera litoralis TaxID=552518 RepID=A0A0F3ISZ4_9PROT|nr:isochorismatase family protein [Elstera litoralis]KJV09865.1 hypothetical protein VZ95_08735 [Elstera litoralis]
MLLTAETSALLLVDYQGKLMPMIDGAETVLNRALLLAEAAHLCGVPIWATEQYPQGLGGTAPALVPWIERVFTKTHFNAAAELDLREALAPWRGRRIILGGCEAHVCLLQTALGLHSLGWPVTVVSDAIGSRRASDKGAALHRLTQAGISLISAEMAAFEWVQHRDAPAFKAVLTAVKKGAS